MRLFRCWRPTGTCSCSLQPRQARGPADLSAWTASLGAGVVFDVSPPAAGALMCAAGAPPWLPLVFVAGDPVGPTGALGVVAPSSVCSARCCASVRACCCALFRALSRRRLAREPFGAMAWGSFGALAWGSFGAGAVPAFPVPGRPWTGPVGAGAALPFSRSDVSRGPAPKCLRRSLTVPKANNASLRSLSTKRGTGRPKATNASARYWVVGLGPGGARPRAKETRYAASASRRLSAARALSTAAPTICREAMTSRS